MPVRRDAAPTIPAVSRRIAAIGAMLCLSSSPARGQTIGELAGLKPGPHAVGFEVRYLVDSTRPFLAGAATGRPLRLLIWYPARSGAPDHLTFGAYLALPAPPPMLAEWHRALLARDSTTARRQFAQPDGEAAFARLLGTATWATAGAPSAGRFPLIIHSLGLNDYQLESTALWEFLASHGYVVAVVPQLGPTPDAPRMSFGAAAIELQTADVEFALRALIREPRVDSARIGVIGHSLGGIVAVLAASRRPEIRAVVSLDGSGTTGEGKRAMDSIAWQPSRMRAALLNVYRAPQPQLDLSVVDATDAASRHDVVIRSATHFDFQNWPLYATFSRAADQRGAGFRAPEVGRGVVYATAMLTRDFFDRELKRNTGAGTLLRGGARLTPIVDSLITVTTRPARPR